MNPEHTRSGKKAKCTAVVLIGHGAPATDCPPEMIGELMGLEWRKDSGGGEPPGLGARVAELDAAIRNWPRNASNDPYKTGLERVAETLKPLMPDTLFAIGYNEFCHPSTADAIDEVIAQGATHIFVIPSMLTPGGIHSERDIPQSLEAIRRGNPGVAINYVWPFDVHQVAELLAAHIKRATDAIPTNQT